MVYQHRADARRPRGRLRAQPRRGAGALRARTSRGWCCSTCSCPTATGSSCSHELRREAPDSRVIVITANGSINRAVQAMRAGAFDFLVKPFDEARLLSAVQNALASAPHPPEEAAAQLEEAASFQGFIGRSPAMTDIYRMVRAIGRSTATVFITGESGTGKEVCARAIHAMSTRAGQALRAAQLRRHPARPARIGGLRPPQGRLHRRALRQARRGGGGGRRHALPRRDLRDGPVAADQAAALPADLDDPAGRRDPRRCRSTCASSARPTATRPRRCAPGGSARTSTTGCTSCRSTCRRCAARPEDILDIAQASLLQFAAEEGKAFTGFDAERRGDPREPALARQRAPAAQRDPQHRRAARRAAGRRRRCCRPSIAPGAPAARRRRRSRRCRRRAACRARPPATGSRCWSARRSPRSSAS